MLGLAGLQNHYRQAQSENQTSAQHGPNAAQDFKSTIASPSEEGPAPNPNPDRQEWRYEQDLQAQRDMAQWALFMVIATFASVAIATIVAVYVRHTLKATQDAVKAANRSANETKRIGEAQVRAYVTVRDVQMSLKPGKRHPTVSFEVGNSGNSPALEVTPSAGVKFRIGDKEIGNLDGSTGVLLGTLAQGGERNYSIEIKTLVLSDEDINLLKGNRNLVEVRVTLQYKDVFAAHIREQFKFMGRFRYPIPPGQKINVPPWFDIVNPQTTMIGATSVANAHTGRSLTHGFVPFIQRLA
jgi:hypothetical protein